MTHLEKLVNTFTEIGYTFVVIANDGWTYVVLCAKHEVFELEAMDPDHIYDHAMFEFDSEGNWASHP